MVNYKKATETFPNQVFKQTLVHGQRNKDGTLL
jgi:hypothetical protein